MGKRNCIERLKNENKKKDRTQKSSEAVSKMVV